MQTHAIIRISNRIRNSYRIFGDDSVYNFMKKGKLLKHNLRSDRHVHIITSRCLAVAKVKIIFFPGKTIFSVSEAQQLNLVSNLS